MKSLARAATVLAAVIIAFPVSAGQQSVASRVGTLATRNMARTAAGRSISLVHGTAVNVFGAPLPNVRLQLRNLDTGRIADITTANYAGEFSFIADAGIPYVVELTDQAGAVLAAANIVAAQAGETIGALVILPARIPTIAGIFGNTAGSVMSAAASAGISAVTTTLPPGSPEQ